MINFDNIIRETIKEHHPNKLQIPDHLCRMLINGGPGSGKKMLNNNCQ